MGGAYVQTVLKKDAKFEFALNSNKHISPFLLVLYDF